MSSHISNIFRLHIYPAMERGFFMMVMNFIMIKDYLSAEIIIIIKNLRSIYHF